MREVAIPSRSPKALHTPNACHSIKSLNLYRGFFITQSTQIGDCYKIIDFNEVKAGKTNF